MPQPCSSRLARVAGPLGGLGLALLLGLGVSACSSTDTSSSSHHTTTSRPTPSAAPAPTLKPTPQAAAPVPRPRVGACHRLTYAGAVAPTDASRAVPCPGAHTATTYDVGTLDDVVDGHLLAVDSRAVQQQLATDCPARLPAYVGGTPDDLRISMLRAIWFSPTIAESDAGADWYRCDVVLLAGSDRLARLDGSVRGALGAAGWEDRYGRCGTEDPADVGFEPVVCSRPHSWQAIAAPDYPSAVGGASAPYPGSSALVATGTKACEGPARTRATDPLTVTWSYQPPTRGQWREGQHYGLCWVPTGP